MIACTEWEPFSIVLRDVTNRDHGWLLSHSLPQGKREVNGLGFCRNAYDEIGNPAGAQRGVCIGVNTALRLWVQPCSPSASTSPPPN